MTQLFGSYFFFFGDVDITLLTVMACDHYMSSASPCTTWPSWPGISVPCWWRWLGWGASWIHWLSFCWSFSCPSVDLMWSITFSVTCIPCWNLPAPTHMSLVCWWWPKVGSSACWPSSCWLPPTLSSAFLEVPPCKGEAQSPLHLWGPLHCCYLILCSLYIYLHVAIIHFIHRQNSGWFFLNVFFPRLLWD